MSKSKKNYQKLFQATLAMTMATGVVVATVSATANAQTFADLDVKQDYYNDVLELTKRGIIKGFPDGTYKPNDAVTRGQAAKIIAGVLDLDTKNVKDPGFTDVKKTDEYYGAIAALAEAGIISGYPDKTFKQSQTLTRGQMAKIIAIGFGLEEEQLKDDHPFTDVKPTNEYAKYIQALLSNGITKGTTATTFAPSDSVKRGQIASFIVRSEKVVKQQTAEVLKVTGDSIVLSTGTFTLPASAKGVLNATNANALKGAKLTYTAKGKQIETIHLLTLNAEGTSSEHLILDGNNTAFDGKILINGDFVEMKNITLQGDLEIGDSVKTISLGNNVVIENIILPSDTKIKDVVRDYDNVKEKIKRVNGEKNPDLIPVTPPATGGDTKPETSLPGGTVDEKNFSGTVDAPKVYNGDVTVNVDDIVKFENIVIKGNLIFIGSPDETVTFNNIKVEKDLDLTKLEADVIGLDSIEVSGETIL